MTTAAAPRRIRKLLVANRSEIAIRVFRAATELGLRTVAIYSLEDRFALHRFKADEAYQVGRGAEPVRAYLGIEEIMRVARDCGADAIHPGYGFLAENPELAEACVREGITWVGPPRMVMDRLGNKVEARALAERAGVPVMPATGALPDEPAEWRRQADEVGFPLMVKASWGGGGRGMRMVHDPAELEEAVATGRREARAAFGNGEVFLERLVERAWHIEVQILADEHGNVVHLHERDCTVQRRHQKVVEIAPSPRLDPRLRREICDAAVRLMTEARYVCAGTVEFLVDAERGEFFFIEVNPRVQVEHTVTEVVTGIDIVKAQIRLAQGATIGEDDCGVPPQDGIRVNGSAMQCRITTEDPENHFIPDYGRISAYREATGFGIRLDGGTAYSSAVITPFYDSLLEKVTAWAPTHEESVLRMDRALREFRIRGVRTNLPFLEALISHPRFRAGDYTTRFIDETPELFRFRPRRDRATRLLQFIAEVLVNGNPEVAGRARPEHLRVPRIPDVPPRPEEPRGTRDILEELGPEGFSRWMRDERRLLLTDTTFRDAHQSLLATRFRTHDLVGPAPYYARHLSGLLSLEAWGGATFDVAMRFLREDPWDRLARLRAAVPNILIQMLLRSSNAVGYTNYPDNVVRFFVQQAAEGGVDLFRVFDSLNWVENMHVAMDAVLESGKLLEASICYTGDLTDPTRTKYDLAYYTGMARQLEDAGAHILGIKDMAGLCKPEAARMLVTALKAEIGIPIHFHTHDTSGISAASVLAAADAGVDAADVAMDPMSGLTSQPNLGSIVEALRGGPRDTGFEREPLARAAAYWEAVRDAYAGFESEMRAGAAEVYEHEMPGGQYTNLRQQARALGIESRWREVAGTYAAVNRMFGDIVKVTPTSKVVGDLAVYMVTNDLTPDDVLDPDHEIAFPDSVVEFFHGDLGQPHGGFPEALQRKVLKGEPPLTVRPGQVLEPIDIDAARAEVEKAVRRRVSDQELAGYLMYPKVFTDFAEHQRTYGDVSVLPTPVFLHGMTRDEELFVDIERGKTLVIRFLTIGEADDEGRRTIFFELNGQPREVKVVDRSVAPTGPGRRMADEGDPTHVPAPMPGLVVAVLAHEGDRVERGDRLLSIEAMKMETGVFADRDGVVLEVLVGAGTQVDTKQLMVVVGDPADPGGDGDDDGDGAGGDGG
ncbi:pyruvate carboxylase [Miltoncostaea oceani]|uniref:pyruvate carboxylase n=1 Tax=Miltoncostaea oceani TaxID=2843216 RepID=UPI001C3DE629|nr:pyruvate carboxylase [Miltoncostaea oceani]